MNFRRKLDETTMCMSVAPVTVAPMGVRLKRKRLQDDPKKGEKKKEDTIKERVDDLIARVCSEKSISVWPPALDRIKLHEPTRKPRVMPTPSFGSSVKELGRKVGHKVLSGIKSFAQTPPYPTAPASQQLPIRQSALDRIKLVDDPKKREPFGGEPKFQSSAKPGNPKIMKADGGKPTFLSKWVQSKVFPSVSFPGPGHSMAPAAKGPSKRQPGLKHGNKGMFKKPHGAARPVADPDFSKALPMPSGGVKPFRTHHDKATPSKAPAKAKGGSKHKPGNFKLPKGHDPKAKFDFSAMLPDPKV